MQFNNQHYYMLKGIEESEYIFNYKVSIIQCLMNPSKYADICPLNINSGLQKIQIRLLVGLVIICVFVFDFAHKL